MVYRYATTRIPILTTIRVFLGAATRHATFYTETNVVEMTITSINVITTLVRNIFPRDSLISQLPKRSQLLATEIQIFILLCSLLFILPID